MDTPLSPRSQNQAGASGSRPQDASSNRAAMVEAAPVVQPDVRSASRPRETARPQAAEQPRWRLGVGRPALAVEDLPTPEEAFQVRRMGLEERLLISLGPAVIALGISLGSGEWMLGPQTVAQYGFKGIFWVALVSVILQVFYNIELARYTLATGESPIVGFGRTPPGYWFWVPLALVCFYMAFILGGWTVSAGQSLFALIVGRTLTPADLAISRQIGIALLLCAFVLLLFGRKIERTLEMVQGAFLPYILLGLFMVSLVIVPGDYWQQALKATVVPSRPPVGTDVSLLGALAGFAALASGLNFMFIGYYRDKGYGMGTRTGYLSGLIGGEKGTLQPVGKTFPENSRNALVWKRWFRMLLFDQLGIYFVGAVLGILLPSLIGGYLISTAAAAAAAEALPGAVPITNTLDPVTFIATALGDRYGQLLGGWGLIIGFVVLFSTQIVVLELLARNLTEGLYSGSARLRAWTGEDPRRFYYPALLVLIVAITVFTQLSLPNELIVLSGNLSNFSAMIFPLVMIYLNRQLPRPARITWWSYVTLLANVIFFGFFFLNFLVLQITGVPMYRF